MSKKVSVILPLYNGENGVSKAIESVLSQTYRNFELIIVNDSSVNGTKDVLCEYISKDHRIKFVNNEINEKLSDSLNIGFSKASGEYLTWISGNDTYKPEAINTMVEYIDKYDDIDLVYCDYDVVDSDGNLKSTTKLPEPDRLKYENIVGICFLYRKELADKIGEYDPELFPADDYEYWIKAYLNGKLYHIPEVLCNFGWHDERPTATNKIQVYHKTYEAKDRHFDELRSKCSNQDEKNEFYRRMLRLIPDGGERASVKKRYYRLDKQFKYADIRKTLSENNILSKSYICLSPAIKGIKRAIWMITNFIGAKLLVRLERDHLVIVHVDGGLASQMLRASLGKQFEERGCNVRYELFYYTEDGLDNDQLETREFELDKCFPSSEIRAATIKEFKRYKMLYDYESGLHGRIESIDSWDIGKPLLLSRFSSDGLLEWKNVPRYFDLEEVGSIIGLYAKKIYEGMETNKKDGIINIGVHVRRGDMVKTGGYWKVLTGKYFVEAMKRIEAEFTDKRLCYYFFSNGFDFVREEIIPYIGDIKYVTVDKCNKDYEDFYLYCRCDVHVKSQGSWGMIAYYYNNSPNKRLVTYDWGKDFKDSIYIELDQDMFI